MIAMCLIGYKYSTLQNASGFVFSDLNLISIKV